MKHIKEFNRFEMNEALINWILIGASAFFVFKFLKGFFDDLLSRENLPPGLKKLKDDYRKKIEPIQISLLSIKLEHLLRSHHDKIKVSETYGLLTLEVEDLTIKINKIQKTITFNKISLSDKVEKEFVEPIHLSQKELTELEDTLKNNDNVV